MNPNQEMLDVVDDNDVVISQRSFSDCHNLGLRHRAVHIEIYSDTTQKNVLILRRSENKKNHPGRLEIPGGHVHAGESYQTAAERELKEEIGLTIPLTFLTKDANTSSDKKNGFYNRESIAIFRGYWNGQPKDLQLDTNEVSEAAWYPVNTTCTQAVQDPASVNSALKLFTKRQQKKLP